MHQHNTERKHGRPPRAHTRRPHAFASKSVVSRPERLRFTSPGQRPGSRGPPQTRQALKGRHKTVRSAACLAPSGLGSFGGATHLGRCPRLSSSSPSGSPRRCAAVRTIGANRTRVPSRLNSPRRAVAPSRSASTFVSLLTPRPTLRAAGGDTRRAHYWVATSKTVMHSCRERRFTWRGQAGTLEAGRDGNQHTAAWEGRRAEGFVVEAGQQTHGPQRRRRPMGFPPNFHPFHAV